MLSTGDIQLSRDDAPLTDPGEMKSEATRLYYGKKARLGGICIISGYKLSPRLASTSTPATVPIPESFESVRVAEKAVGENAESEADNRPGYGPVTGIKLLEPDEMFEIIRREDREEFKRTGVSVDRSDYKYRGVRMVPMQNSAPAEVVAIPDDDPAPRDIPKLFGKVEGGPFNPTSGIPFGGSNFVFTTPEGELFSAKKGKAKTRMGK